MISIGTGRDEVEVEAGAPNGPQWMIALRNATRLVFAKAPTTKQGRMTTMANAG